MTRIVVNQYYMHENNLVKVVGAAGMDNPDTTRFLIQWGDSQGRACSAEVTRRELSPAPTIERLYQDYRQCLEAICNQANRIEELENAPSLFQQVMTASKTYVERFGGRLTEEGTVDKFDEEAFEFKEAITDLVVFNDDALEHLLEEFVDVMVTAGGVFAYYGIKWPAIEAAARAKLKVLTDRKASDYVWHEESKTVIKRSKLEVKS